MLIKKKLIEIYHINLKDLNISSMIIKTFFYQHILTMITKNGTIYVIDLYQSKILYAYHQIFINKNFILTSCNTFNNLIFIASQTGKLFIFNSINGKILYNEIISSSFWFTSIYFSWYKQLLFLGTNTCDLLLFDCLSADFLELEQPEEPEEEPKKSEEEPKESEEPQEEPEEPIEEIFKCNLLAQLNTIEKYQELYTQLKQVHYYDITYISLIDSNGREIDEIYKLQNLEKKKKKKIELILFDMVLVNF